jgi:hypothetical protein
MRRAEENRPMKAEPAADEPSAQGAPSRQPNTVVGGAGGGVTPTGKVSMATPEQRRVLDPEDPR